ncbi:putative peptidase family-domain-containing protein [Xylaria acuta]|nr:putative peptidase family-domain-containing protein [Xylaria acuta]
MLSHQIRLFIAFLGFNPVLAEGSRLRLRQDVVTVTQTIVSPTPQPSVYDRAAGATTAYPIHGSCNATERALLYRGLNDAISLARHAKDHIPRFGNSSEFYSKYFGTSPTAEVIGWYDKIVSADHSGWGGHWHGENATQETVICPLSYITRMPPEGLCGCGYSVASGALNFYFGSDLVHRLYHLPKIGEGIVEQYADTYSECLALALNDPGSAARNSHTLQYFALDVYAFDIAVPGEGCTGRPSESKGSEAYGPTTAATPSATTNASTECHTHADGTEHCS